MADYTQVTDFSAKDSLSTGDPEKAILGEDVDAELSAIEAAIASKQDSGDIPNSALADMAQARVKGRATGAGTGAPTDLTAGQLASLLLTSSTIKTGTYDPTLTPSTNVDTVVKQGNFTYVRVGDVILVFGAATVDCASADTSSVFTISLPVASALANSYELVGVASEGGSEHRGGSISGSAPNDNATVTFRPQSASSFGMQIMFVYLVI